MALATPETLAELKKHVTDARADGKDDLEIFYGYAYATLMTGRDNWLALYSVSTEETHAFAEDHADFLVHAMYELGWTHPTIKPAPVDA